MLGFIEGKVIRINERLIIVVANGVGYEINVTNRLSVENNDIISLYLHLTHKEDSMNLYGFLTREEKNMFLTLISARGIGAKLAMEILSTYPINEIIELLFTQNIKKLTKIPGMGGKKAEKLLFELKDKIDKIDIGISSGQTENYSDAAKALISLGFSSSEALNAINKIDNYSDKTTEILISEALQILAKI